MSNQNVRARLYLTTNITDTPTSTYFRVELDTVLYDIGGHFNMSTWSTGTCDAGSGAAAIVDASPSKTFMEAMRYAKISWHDGYGHITTVTDGNNLVIVTVNGSNIDVGDTYTIKHCEYEVPITRYYLVSGQVTYANLVADQRYFCGLFKYTAGAWSRIQQTAISAALAATHYVNSTAPCYLKAGDLIALFGYHTAGATTVDINGGTVPDTALSIDMLP